MLVCIHPHDEAESEWGQTKTLLYNASWWTGLDYASTAAVLQLKHLEPSGRGLGRQEVCLVDCQHQPHISVAATLLQVALCALWQRSTPLGSPSMSVAVSLRVRCTR